MIKPSQKLIESQIDSLSIKDKIQLLRKLQKDTSQYRFDSTLKTIDRKLKKFPLSQKEVDDEIKAHRKEKHVQGRR